MSARSHPPRMPWWIFQPVADSNGKTYQQWYWMNIDYDIMINFDCLFVWFCLVLFGFVWFCLVLSGFVWFCLVLFGFVWFCLVLFCLVCLFVCYLLVGWLVGWLVGLQLQYAGRIWTCAHIYQHNPPLVLLRDLQWRFSAVSRMKFVSQNRWHMLAPIKWSDFLCKSLCLQNEEFAGRQCGSCIMSI